MKHSSGGSWQVLSVDAIGAAVCLGLTAIGYFTVVVPYLQSEEVRITLTADHASRSQQATEVGNSIAALELELASTKHKLTENPLVLEPAGRLNPRLATLGSIASDCGLDVDEMHVESANGLTDYQTIPIKLRGRGNFQAAITFLHRLHEGSPDIAVDAFTLSANPAAPETAATFAFDLTWFAALSGAP